MTHDVDVLKNWIQACLVLAAIFTTAFPILYLFSPWYSTKLGRLLMLQAVAFAIAIDCTLLFQFWFPSNILVIFWINAIVFFLIAISTGALTLMLWRTNHNKRPPHPMRRETDA
jgi:hypothetical protein